MPESKSDFKCIAFNGEHSGLEEYFRLECWGDQRIIWRRGDFVVVVAIVDNKIVMITEFKHAVQENLLCLPAGAMKDGETPQDAGLRELFEETGYIGQPETCKVFGPFFNSPDKSTERHFVVLVNNVKEKVTPSPDQGEKIIGVTSFPFHTAASATQIAVHKMAIYFVLDTLNV